MKLNEDDVLRRAGQLLEEIDIWQQTPSPRKRIYSPEVKAAVRAICELLNESSDG